MPAQPHSEVHIGRDGQRIEISCVCRIGREHDYDTWAQLVGGARYNGIEDAAR